MGIILILLLSSLSFNTIGENNKSIITVDDDGDGDYIRIQDAIDNASDGDTVYVYNGRYYETLIIDKSITIEGEHRDNTIIDGDFNGNVVTIFKDNVTLVELSIQHSGNNDNAGIHSYCKYSTVINCNLSYNDRAMRFDGKVSNYNEISYNFLFQNNEGILLQGSDYNHISNNTIIRSGIGIFTFNN
jgi:parallel beta-helix repeat protein